MTLFSIATQIIFGIFLTPSDFSEPSTPAERAAEIEKEFQAKSKAYVIAHDAARTAEQRSKLPKIEAIIADSAAQRLELAEAYPDSPEAFRGLTWIILNSPSGVEGKKLIARMIETKMMGKTPTEIVKAFNAARTSYQQNGSELADACLNSCKDHPTDPETGSLLASVCFKSRLSAGDKPPKIFREAADLILSKYAADDGISHFCESLFLYGAPKWAGEFETHLKTIVKKNSHSTIRFTSRFALCEIELAKGGDHQKSAANLFEKYVEDFEPETKEYPIAMSLVPQAKNHVERLKTCAIGMEAPAFAGVDLGGEKISLKDYRGRVVVLVFWFSACGPCMSDVPHELELVKKFEGRPFAILGVNCDSSQEEAKLAVKKYGIAWPSLADRLDKTYSVPKLYHVSGYPTVIVIDHNGVIREDRLRGEELDKPLEELVRVAEKKK